MRKPFKKNLKTIPIEEAHGGSGKRQLILSKNDAVSEQFQAMTKGYLKAGSIFDWHSHEGIDEFFLVLKGRGFIEFKGGEKIEYSSDDLIYIPDGIEHKIEATGNEENEFLFVRINK
jgi:mannose-6-phosphate isomerase-like protein (cupin superfamily)